MILPIPIPIPIPIIIKRLFPKKEQEINNYITALESYYQNEHKKIIMLQEEIKKYYNSIIPKQREKLKTKYYKERPIFSSSQSDCLECLEWELNFLKKNITKK